MTSFLLRKIPTDLWIAAKHKAIDEKISLRQLVLNAIARYVSNEKTD